MNVSYEFKWNPKVYNGLKKMPDDILFEIAKQTLDMAVSTEAIPIDTKKMRNLSVEFGVRKHPGDMIIGSPTGYASRVWVMPQSTTNWTNKGKAHNKWYAYILKKYGQTFIDNAISKSWKKDM